MKFEKISLFVDYAFAAIFSASVLVFLMLTGCSDLTAGGTAEETSVTALNVPNDTSSKNPAGTTEILYENLNLKGFARSVAQLPNSKPELTLDSVVADTVFEPVTSERLGYTVRLSELDSVTLEPTGVSYLSQTTDSSGAFVFEGISLNTPFVMLELSPYRDEVFWLPDSQSYYWYGFDPDDYDSEKSRYRLVYKAVADLRDSGSLDVNSLSLLETVRIQNLVKGGSSFANAKLQAMKEVLAFMGVEGSVIDLQNPRIAIAEENLGYILENWTRYDSSKDFTDAFATTGTVVGDSRINSSISVWLFNWYEYYLLYREDTTDENEIEFMNNFLANFTGVGQCTAEKDGFDTTLYDLWFRSLINRKLTLVCESGAWNVTPGRYTMDEKIEFTTGTMTDGRDGRTYKTVTYNIDGELQTWFAENLVYSDDRIQPEIGLDSTMFYMNQGRDGDFWEYMESLDSTYWNTIARYKKSDVIGGDEIHMENGRFQGICPDGWHIPTRKEWSRLMYFAEVETGMSSREEAESILKYEDFGWYASLYLREVGFGDFTLEGFAILENDHDVWSLYGLVMDNWKPDVWDVEGGITIRCVKDE